MDFALPLALAAVGGALGGLIGAIAAIANGRIFRLANGNLVKYGFTGLVTATSVLVYFGLVLVILGYLSRP